MGIVLAACARAPTPPQVTPQLPPGGRIEWRGTLACADCDGIDTRLVLEQHANSRRYVLTETFLAPEGSARFVERGQWRAEPALIRLQGDNPRVYAVLEDFRLVPGDSRGRHSGAVEGQVLEPFLLEPR